MRVRGGCGRNRHHCGQHRAKRRWGVIAGGNGAQQTVAVVDHHAAGTPGLFDVRKGRTCVASPPVDNRRDGRRHDLQARQRKEQPA